MNKEEYYKFILRQRGVNTPCETCKGLGNRMYGSGATWRGGMGTAAITTDVCDICWGTGDAQRKGVDLRKMEAEREAWEEEQCIAWLSRQLGVSFTETRARLKDVSEFCHKQANKRKIPRNTEPFWHSYSWDALGCIFARLAEKKG